MAKLRMAPASTHGARKPPGPIIQLICSYRLLAILIQENNSYCGVLRRIACATLGSGRKRSGPLFSPTFSFFLLLWQNVMWLKPKH